MPATLKQKLYLPNAVLGSLDSAGVTPGVTPTPGTGVTLHRSYSLVPQRLVFKLTDFVVSMAAANDYGSTKLCDLPVTGVIVLGCVVDLTAAVASLTTNQVDAVDLAIGTVATASAAFSNAGEKNLTAKIDGVGAAATGTISGASVQAETAIKIASGTNAVYVNCSSPVTAGTGTVTLNGYIELLVLQASKVGATLP